MVNLAKFAGNHCVETLKVSDREWLSILGCIEERARSFKADEDAPVADRRRYRKVLHCVVRVEHPGGTPGTYLVRSRNISAKGLGFIHGNFIYPGTKCRIALDTENEGGIVVSGRTVWCRHLSGTAHEVGVEFVHPIDIDLFIDEEDKLEN